MPSDSVDSLIAKSQSAFSADDFEDAFKLLNLALDIEPENKKVIELLTRVRMARKERKDRLISEAGEASKTGEITRATTALERALVLGGDSLHEYEKKRLEAQLEEYKMRERVQRAIPVAEHLFRTGNYEAAERELVELDDSILEVVQLRQTIREAQDLFATAKKDYDDDRYSLAFDQFQIILGLVPDDKQAHEYANLAGYKAALEKADKALQLMPPNYLEAKHYYQLAQHYRQEPSEEIEQKLLELASRERREKEIEKTTRKAASLLAQSEFSKAIDTLTQALELYPDNLQLKEELEQARVERKRAILTQALNLFRDGEELLRQGKTNEAEDHFEKARRRNPDDGDLNTKIENNLEAIRTRREKRHEAEVLREEIKHLLAEKEYRQAVEKLIDNKDLVADNEGLLALQIEAETAEKLDEAGNAFQAGQLEAAGKLLETLRSSGSRTFLPQVTELLKVVEQRQNLATEIRALLFLAQEAAEVGNDAEAKKHFVAVLNKATANEDIESAQKGIKDLTERQASRLKNELITHLNHAEKAIELKEYDTAQTELEVITAKVQAANLEKDESVNERWKKIKKTLEDELQKRAEVKQLCAKAQGALAQGDYKTASELLSDASQKAPNDVAVIALQQKVKEEEIKELCAKAQGALAQGDYKTASKLLSEASQKAPNDIAVIALQQKTKKEMSRPSSLQVGFSVVAIIVATVVAIYFILRLFGL